MHARRRFAALLVAVIAVLSAPLAIAGPDAARPAQAASSSLPLYNSVRIVIDSIEPRIVIADDTLTVSGTLTNETKTPITDMSITLQSDKVARTRAQLEAVTDNPHNRYYRNSCTIGRWVQLAGALAPQAHRSFTVSCKTKDLDITEAGVYPLLVNLNARTPAYPVARVGEAYTVIPFFPKTPTRPAQVSWLWPIVGTPHRLVGTTRQPVDNLFADDTLATLFARGGRYYTLLSEALRASPATHFTLVLDPDIVDSASVMASTTKPYQVQTATGRRPGRGAAAAREWLAMLRELIKRPTVAVNALPYADTDLVALAHAGAVQTIGLAYARGQKVINSVLHIEPSVLAWPADGALDSRALGVLASLPPDGFILSPDALPIKASAIPGATTELSSATGNRRALVSDAVINSVATATKFPDGRRVVEQRYLAELAIIAAAPANVPRTVLVSPPRQYLPDAFTERLLDDTNLMPWSSSVSVASMLDKVPTSRGPLHYSAQAAAKELPASLIAASSTVRTQLDHFSTALVGAAQNEQLGGFYPGVLRSTSSAWRGHPENALPFLGNVQTQLASLRNQVMIQKPSNGKYSLSSSSGRLVVTVDNKLDFPVTVVVTARSKGTNGFSADAVTQVIREHSLATVRVPAKVERSGRFPAYLELRTPDGMPLGTNQRIELQSTAYGVIGIVITAVAFGALLILVARRLYQRIRRARHPDPPGTPTAPATAPATAPSTDPAANPAANPETA